MIFSFLKSLSAKHTALKERIHAFRIPLPPMGQKIMGFIYSVIPVVSGYYVMQWAQSRAVVNLGEKGEKLENSEIVDRNRQASKQMLRNILEKDKSKAKDTGADSGGLNSAAAADNKSLAAGGKSSA
jgi:hypothetical protein